jgi:putative ABC transport system permease protein
VDTLTLSDAEAIATSPEITTISKVSAEYQSRAQVIAGKNNTNTQIIGVLPDYAAIRNVSVASGTFISQNNVGAVAKVAVVGPQVVSDLFSQGANPIGKTLRINGQVFSIIGVTTSKGGSGFFNQDDIVYIPLTTAQKVVFGVNHLSSISLSAKSDKVMTQAQNEITALLLTRHKIKNAAQADFRISSQEDLLSTVSQVTGTFTTLLSGIAAISLVVGGIGIMNIMLVTVTERTREVGLRKALGAKKKIITTQFLTEAVAITFIGGLIGTTIGILVSYILSRVMSLPFVISIASILLAFFVSAAVGIVFGLYPARKASNLQPIEALRYE